MSSDNNRELSFSLAINEAITQSMSADPAVMLIGQGVKSPWYVGNTCKDLIKKFGEERVIDTPVSENAMTGAAVGAAIAGMKAIVVHPRVDFTLYAFDPIINQAANWHYMSGGKSNVPVVFWLIINRGGEQAAQHSQALHSVFAHIPGLKVITPSTAYDAKGLFIASINDPNPVVFIDDRWLYSQKGTVPEEMYEVPIGKGIIRKEGKDITLVSYSYMAVESAKAVEELSKEGISTEFIDLRTIKPYDEELIINSVKKTGRLIVADGSWKTNSFAAEIIATVAEKAFNHLKAPAARVCLPDTPAPASSTLENAYYPTCKDIINTIKSILMEKRKVRFVEPAKLYRIIKEELDAAYFDVMSRGELIDREHLKSFEANLARFVGTKYAVGLNSGYDSLHMSLLAAGISNGDEVIVPAHTFVASCSAIVNTGATPVLVDVAKDFNINADKIEEVITKKTKAIMPVHLSGWMADMPKIMKIAEKHNLAVIEDACQSLGSTINGKGAGAWGLTGCFSFYPFKILGGYGDGGAITTNSEEVATFARRMRFNGEDRETGEYHGHGFTCLLDNIQAAFLDIKLRYMPEWIKRRKQIANRYKEALSDIPDLLLPHYNRPDSDHVYQNYTIRSKQGNEFSEYLKENGIEVLTQFRKPYYKHRALKLTDSGFPETEALSSEVCSLPMNVEIDDEEIDYVIKVVRAFYGNHQ